MTKEELEKSLKELTEMNQILNQSNEKLEQKVKILSQANDTINQELNQEINQLKAVSEELHNMQLKYDELKSQIKQNEEKQVGKQSPWVTTFRDDTNTVEIMVISGAGCLVKTSTVIGDSVKVFTNFVPNAKLRFDDVSKEYFITSH